MIRLAFARSLSFPSSLSFVSSAFPSPISFALRVALVALPAVMASACGMSGDGAAAPTEAKIVDRVATFDTSGAFTRIDRSPFASQHAAANVSVWVSDEGLDAYLGVDPADTTATVDDFATGTIIVKEMFDATGARTGLTAMAKGGEGGDPTSGWWWGVFGPAGALSQGGAVPFCIDCHQSNGLARTDWVRGVALDDRM